MENYTPEKKSSAESGGNAQSAKNSHAKQPRRSNPFPKSFGLIVLVIVLILVFLVAFRPVYILKGLGQQEMGVMIKAGQVQKIVGPGGVYNDFGLFVRMETYNIEAVPFEVADDEVFTKDMQPVHVEIRGQVFRPSLTAASANAPAGTTPEEIQDAIKSNFVNYRRIYTSDDVLINQMDGFSKQAMKVCVGQNDLRGNAVAEGRDFLRNCIESELEKLAADIGLYINNLVVTDVKASDQAMIVINETNQYLLDSKKAEAQAQKLEAEGKANAVQKEAEIRVQQAAAQETARQQVTLAELEEKKLIARRAVIEAEKENAILEQELNREKALAAAELAKAELAQTILLAQIYQDNPAYFNYLVAQINASAIKETDKVMILPEGTIPNLVLGRDILPVTNVDGSSFIEP